MHFNLLDRERQIPRSDVDLNALKGHEGPQPGGMPDKAEEIFGCGCLTIGDST